MITQSLGDYLWKEKTLLLKIGGIPIFSNVPKDENKSTKQNTIP